MEQNLLNETLICYADGSRDDATGLRILSTKDYAFTISSECPTCTREYEYSDALKLFLSPTNTTFLSVFDYSTMEPLCELKTPNN